MSFSSLHIRFQSAGMMPAPYTHFYELTARPGTTEGVFIDFSITYTDREELDEEDIAGEGFTMTDDFAWSGSLGSAWLPVLDSLTKTTQLTPFDENDLGEDEDFIEVTIERSAGTPQTGTPTSAEDFLYPIQELIQAIYEAGGKEKPFELSYLSYQRNGDVEVHLQAQFATRTLRLVTVQHRQEQRRILPWNQLQSLMGEIFAHDYIPGEGMAKPPKRDGYYLSVTGDEWYDIGELTNVQDALNALV